MATSTVPVPVLITAIFACLQQYILSCQARYTTATTDIQWETSTLEIQTTPSLVDIDPYFPPQSPGGLMNNHPILYFSTVVLLLVILFTTLLMVFRACIRGCKHCKRRSTSTHRPPTNNTVVSKSRLYSDDPPDYATVMTSNNNKISDGNKLNASINALLSESPPPSYGSIM